MIVAHIPSDQLDLSDNSVVQHPNELPRLQLQSSSEKPLQRRKKVLVLYTGGTMGMKPNQLGALAPSPGYLTEQLYHMPELKNPTVPSIKVREYSPLLDSSDMTSSDWATIATDIAENYFDYEGFVVVMGTDTMAYCASALSFMLENLGKTVVCTGSMIPFCVPYNDARRNMLVSLLVAANIDIPEVCIFFNQKLFRGNRATKVSSAGLDAFQSPNYPPLAHLGVGLAVEEWAIRPQPKGRFRLHTLMDSKLVVLRLTPVFDDNFLFEALREERNQDVKAIVLELYGVGNIPNKKEGFFKGIEEARKKDILVVVTSQCLSGKVELGEYAVAERLKTLGAISGSDMTTEAIVTKLSYLFGRGIEPATVRAYMEKDLRGELSPNRRFSQTILSATEMSMGRL